MSLRRVDISDCGACEPPPAPGERPRLEWVEVSKLRIDERYQRDLRLKNWRSIRRIATTFDWAMFTPVTVAPGAGDDQWILIDGQHRAHAAALAGIETIPAAIIDISTERQAAVFSGINTQRTAVSAFHLYRAALTSGEPWAIRAARAVQNGGCTLMTYNKSSLERKPREIFTVALIRDHVRAQRDAAVTAGLRALSGSSTGDDAALYQQAVLKPWLAVVVNNPSLLKRNLAVFVSETDLIATCTSEAVGIVEPGVSKYQAAMVIIREKLARFEWKDQMPAHRPALVPNLATQALPPEPHGQWTDDRDALLRNCGGTYRELAALADGWGLPTASVTARWHRVRAAA